MNKIKVYIDFEVISSPFNWDLNINELMPYAYSLGIYVGGKFKTRTHIVNYNEVNVKNIFLVLKEQITNHIRSIIGNEEFLVNSRTVEFYAFALELEKQIIDKMFKNISLIDVSKGRQISLEKATEREMGKKTYFEEFKKIVKLEIDPKFIIRRNLMKDGALAALAGYILYVKSKPDKKYKYKINMSIKTLLKEIKEYSKDDVLRMKMITDDYESFYIKVKKWKEIIKINTLYRKQLRRNNVVIEELQREDKNQTLNIYLKKILEKTNELKQKNPKDEIL